MRTNVYIDASNLFYGGEKSLGWKVDYKKLFSYLREKYGASRVFYFAGVEVCRFPTDNFVTSPLPLGELEAYLVSLLDRRLTAGGFSESEISRHLSRTRFLMNLESIGYELVLKPVKSFRGVAGAIVRKANCDVDISFFLLCDQDMFDRAVILSGDGDFLPVMRFLREIGKGMIVLARGSRTAKEIRRFAGENFRDFEYLRERLRYVAGEE